VPAPPPMHHPSALPGACPAGLDTGRPAPQTPSVAGPSAAADSDSAIQIGSGQRLSVYSWVVGLTFASVPFLHLYLPVPLGPRELAVHALDVALLPVATLALVELAGRALLGGSTWHLSRGGGLCGLASVATAAFGVWLLVGPTDWLPGTAEIRAKHVHAGYANMSLRLLPFGAAMAWLIVTSVRRSELARQVARLERELSNCGAIPKRLDRAGAPLALEHDGGELHVLPTTVRCVVVRENYCEFVLDPEARGRPVRRVLVRTTLSGALERLPSPPFAQTHRSHIANLERVTAVQRDGRQASLRLDSGDVVPIARGRLAEVRDQLTLARG